MPITPTAFENIKLGYIHEDDGYVKGLSVAEANDYAELYPDTQFIFIDGDGEVRFLDISGVNQLTPKDLLRSDQCDTSDKPCGPPVLKFFGGHGVGAKANPVVDVHGNLIAVDLVDGGFGYTSPPQVQVIDPCKNGSGAVLQTILGTGDLTGVVVKVIVSDSGNGGYLPPAATTTTYPALLTITDVVVKDPGIGYNCGVDKLTVTPSNGTVLSYKCDPFGKIKKVTVTKGGNFTELPRITMDTETGFNAKFTPVFDIIRDPEPQTSRSFTQEELIQVYDLVGLNHNGYVGGKEYYGNVYFIDGIKYAGTDSNNGTDVRVYDTREESSLAPTDQLQ
tara:strand:- start:1073 stop:2077 length:1005 start_codon:yes stop_codon:yes gene_type:complete